MIIDAIYKTIVQLSLRATQGMQNLLRQGLAQPIDTSGIYSKTNITVTKKSNTTVELHTNFPDYAYFTRYGRRAGKMPPEKPIKDWIAKHNIYEGAVFPIRRKIAKKGTKGVNFTTPLERMVEMIKKTVSMEAAVSVKKNIIGGFYDISNIDVKI